MQAAVAMGGGIFFSARKKRKDMNDRKRPEEQQTPITDGDARPDQYPNEQPRLKNVKEKKQRNLTENRGADVNNLEDYKDKK